MKKIRINELARELEVKAHEILDKLPELGVTEKKTHSSSIDEDVALKLRRYYGLDGPEPEAPAATHAPDETPAKAESAPAAQEAQAPVEVSRTEEQAAPAAAAERVE